jgi:uncharacterized protein
MSADNTAHTYHSTERSRVRRLHERGSHEAEAVYAVLDAAPLCHVGYVIEGQPYVTPTIHWREKDRVYWHGSAASRFLRKVDGTQACLTCSLMDGYVLARSAFNHSVNYRSAMVFGQVRIVRDADAVLEALRQFTDGLFPGRWDDLRPVTAQEIKATAVAYMDIEEATAKVRAAPPGDDEDADHPVWAGVLPMHTALAEPQPAAGAAAQLPLPEPLRSLVMSGRLR